MKQTIDLHQFERGFNIRPDNFTYVGIQALFEYFGDLENDLDEQIEFDPIAICCEYTEYTDIGEFQDQYGDEYGDLDQIADYTQVIQINSGPGFIIADF